MKAIVSEAADPLPLLKYRTRVQRMRWIVTSIVLLALSTTLHADELRGKVISIADGDTITVLDAAKERQRIRLEGIDAPEKGQAFGTSGLTKLFPIT